MRGRDGDRGRRSPYLPDDYYLDETDPDEVVLRRRDGSEVAVFSATEADPKEVERVAWEDFRRRKSTAGLGFSSRGAARPVHGPVDAHRGCDAFGARGGDERHVLAPIPRRLAKGSLPLGALA
jgi:hypothetical protein